MQLLFAEEECAQWQWYRSASHQGSRTAATHVGTTATHEGTGNTAGGTAGHHAGFEAIPGAVKRLYVPTQDDEKHILRVQCTPASMWVTLSYTLQRSVLQISTQLVSNLHTVGLLELLTVCASLQVVPRLQRAAQNCTCAGEHKLKPAVMCSTPAFSM